MQSTLNHPTVVWQPGYEDTLLYPLIQEEPLSIRVQGRPYTITMRTPGDEIPHVAGFCLAEGIADSPDDFSNLAFCDGADTNVVTATLTASRRARVAQILERRGFITQTSCGICGKALVKDLLQHLTRLDSPMRISAGDALACIQNLSAHQPLRRKSRATHAAAVYSADLNRMAVAEDVGRHNAVDKAIGKLFLDRSLPRATLLLLSSRVSYELVQKAARAQIPIIVAISRPTALAVQLASSLNMAIACLAPNDGLAIFCGQERIIR